MKMTSSTRFAVRTTLATGTTLATVIGAQALASLDEAAFSQTPTVAAIPAETVAQPLGSTPESQANVSVPSAAPNIVILRHAGAAPSVSPSSSSTASQPGVSIAQPQPVLIQPPNPVQVTVPQPVVRQPQSAPVAARTRSSR